LRLFLLADNNVGHVPFADMIVGAAMVTPGGGPADDWVGARRVADFSVGRRSGGATTLPTIPSAAD
jgi:hypothetical protein